MYSSSSLLSALSSAIVSPETSSLTYSSLLIVRVPMMMSPSVVTGTSGTEASLTTSTSPLIIVTSSVVTSLIISPTTSASPVVLSGTGTVSSVA